MFQSFSPVPLECNITTRPAALLRVAALAVALMTLSGHAQPFNNIVGLNNDETANGMCATRDGGWITVGAVSPIDTPTQRDILAVKYRSDGAVEWAMRYGRDRDEVGYSVRETPDDGYIIAAETTSLGDPFNLLALKIDASGNFLWANAYATTGSDEDLIHRRNGGVAVRLVGEESYVLTSRVRVSDARQDGVIVRVRRDGAPIFQRQYFDPAQEDRSCITFSDIAIDRDEELVVSGSMLFRNDDGTINIDPLLLRARRDGSPVLGTNFQFFVGGNEQGTGDGLDISREDSNIYFDGRTDLGVPDNQAMHLFRVDPGFNLQWMQVHRRLGSSYRTARIDHNNNFTVAGWIGQFPSGSSSMLFSVDLAGNPLFGMRYELSDDFLGNNLLDAEASYGIKGLGSTSAPGVLRSRNRGSANFTRFTFSADRLQQLSFIMNNLDLLLAIQGQYACNTLLVGQRFGIGGASNRAYAPGALTGDSGVQGKAELQYRIPFDSLVRDMVFFAFYSYGRIWNRVPSTDEQFSANVQGIGGGTRLTLGKKGGCYIAYGRPINHKVAGIPAKDKVYVGLHYSL